MKNNLATWISFLIFFLLIFIVRWCLLPDYLKISGLTFLLLFVLSLFTYIILMNWIVKSSTQNKVISYFKKGNDLTKPQRNLFFFSGFIVGIIILKFF